MPSVSKPDLAQIFSRSDEPSKDAIRMRSKRDEETFDETKLRLEKSAAGMQRLRDSRTAEQKDAKKIENRDRMRAKRAADKAAKLANNTENPGVAEFQRIQTVPRSLSFGPQVSKSLSQQGGLPRRNDGTPSSGSDSMSEYEKLRLRNIEERKQKFQEQFGTSDPFRAGPSTQNHKRSLSKLNTDSETSNDEIAPTVEPTRRQPKRQCKSFANKECESSDSSFEAYVDDLVEASTAELEVDPNIIVTPIINTIINSVFGPKPRKQNIGRKSKRALKSAKYRQFNETDNQYQSRLKKSSALKQHNLKNEERSVRKRRLFKLQQTR